MWITALAAMAAAWPLRAMDADQMKSELVGQCMGGREKCWRFRSRDQIKDLVIKNQAEEAQKRVYTVDLKLQDAHATARYSAQARVEYVKAGNTWKIKQVGLLSLRKIE
jgi:hypothetical protein